MRGFGRGGGNVDCDSASAMAPTLRRVEPRLFEFH
jgi:hypothetical protein